MKKLFTVLLILIASVCTAFAFTACDLFGTGGNGAGSAVPDGDSSAEDKDDDGADKDDGTGSDKDDDSADKDDENTSGGNFHTCVFVFTERVDGCVTNGYNLYTCKDPTCGKTEKQGSFAPIGHDYKLNSFAATCTKDAYEVKICTRCGDEKDKRSHAGTKTEHSYVWTETTPASCTADGLKTGRCPDCGATDTEAIPSSGHSYGNYVSNGDASCTADATETAICSVCKGEDTRVVAGTKLDHNYGAYVPNNDASCMKDGTQTAECTDCGHKITENIPGTKVDHEYGSWITVVGTCKIENVHKRTCNNCDHEDSYTDGYGNHKFEPKSSNGTVTGDKCALCGAGLQKTSGKFYLDLTTQDTESSTGAGNLGAVYLEFTVLSVSGSVITYNMDLIQEYTVDGEQKATRQNIAVAYDGKNAGYFSNDFKLWSVSENCELTGGGWIDYSVYKPYSGATTGWIQIILQFTAHNGAHNASYGKYAHTFYLAY